MTHDNKTAAPDICSWCGRPITTIEVGGHLGDAMVERICNGCVDHFLSERGVSLGRYLDTLPVPVLMVNGDMVVQMANAAARRKLGKNKNEVEQYRGGEVFECANARLPGGCGRTIHCSACAIRSSVTRTWETGEPLYDVPASLKPADPGDPDEVALKVSTYKANDMVMLRVDWIERP